MGSRLASSLTDCAVLTTEGTKLGTLAGVEMSVPTGELAALRVRSHDGTADVPDDYRVDDDYLVIPADGLKATDEYLLVRLPR